MMPTVSPNTPRPRKGLLSILATGEPHSRVLRKYPLQDSSICARENSDTGTALAAQPLNTRTPLSSSEGAHPYTEPAA